MRCVLICRSVFAFAGCLITAGASAQEATSSSTTTDFFKLGHSMHGEAFDQGPRQKPWVIEGIGKTHFPITTSNPEVQRWFDQGNTLLHSFWYYEAERAFRWAIKLEPTNSMAYWGLARTTGNRERQKAFIKEAAKGKARLTDRERMYLEAWETFLDDTTPAASRTRVIQTALERIVLKYPDDIEAKALLGLTTMGDNRVGTELILQAVLAKDPAHPGAHHYRIHNWDGTDGAAAIDSCRRYGQISAGIGHAQHMPGHIYSGIGMWHEAAISMDAATRVEAQYMQSRMTLPFNTWNYAHNRNYLSYIQEQLGMPEAAIAGARQLVAAPLDPKLNNAGTYTAHWQGVAALTRALVKYERWDDILAEDGIPWGTSFWDKMQKSYAQGLAHAAKGDRDMLARSFADHNALKADLQLPANHGYDARHTTQNLELQAAVALLRGDTLNHLGLLADAARRELEIREQDDDPPSYPHLVYNELGRAYLAQKSPGLAVAAFEKALTGARNDAFALSGLVEAYAALGEKAKAQEAMATLLYVWSDANQNLPWLVRARATGITATPKDNSPGVQRNYQTTTLNQFGPNVWTPYAAPALSVLDTKGRAVTLDQFRGKNVLLVFYLGSECPHCQAQLKAIGAKKADFERLDTVLLAVSPDTPAENTESLKAGALPVQLLSDVKGENARRFQSYDDFEDKEIHSTILIDKQGRIHWSQNGGAPFSDFDFLMKEVRRINTMPKATTPPSPAAR